jgi:hypothetical protein
MNMPPPIRKIALTVHLSSSVGWLGAVVAYLVFDVTVATSRDPALVRDSWVAMGRLVSVAIIPLALASLVTGLVMAVGTRWGLVRHWWVLISLVLTVVAVVVLLSESVVVARIAASAADAATSDAEVLAFPPTLLHSVGGLAVLFLVQLLNVYKPQGVTPYGWRKQQEERGRGAPGATVRSS